MKASERRYRNDIARDYPFCVCGAPVEQQHHIIHLNGQRITKDEMLVVGLCHPCHTGSNESVHHLGGERQFFETTGWNLVEIAVLRRHNWELQQ